MKHNGILIFGMIGLVSLMIMAPFCDFGRQPTGLSVSLVDDPIDTVCEFWVTITSFEVHGNGAPRSLALELNYDSDGDGTNDAARADLLDLQNGAFYNLIDGNKNENQLPPGQYGNIHMGVSEVMLRLKDEAAEDGCAAELTPATLPSSTFKLNTPFTIEEGKITDLWLVWNANNSLHQTGNGEWKVHPVIGTLAKDVSAWLSGSVSPAPGKTESTDEAGVTTVVETTVNAFADYNTEDSVWTQAAEDASFQLLVRGGVESAISHTVSAEWTTTTTTITPNPEDPENPTVESSSTCLHEDFGSHDTFAGDVVDVGALTQSGNATPCASE